MVTLAAAVLAAAVAAADRPPSGMIATDTRASGMVAAGEKVRVTATGSGLDDETGVVVDADAQSVTVSLGPGKPPVRIPLSSIKRLDVARGRRTAAKEGAISGGILGLVLGVLAVHTVSHALCENATDCDASPQGYGIGAGVFAAGGAGLGALVGLAIKTDRWERVPVDRLRVAIGPVPAGAGVQFSLGWGRR